MFLTSMFLFFPFSLSLPSSHSKVNECILGRGFKKKEYALVTHTSVHELFTRHPSISLAITYPFFIRSFKHQQFIHHPFTIHPAQCPFILHPSSLPYPSSCVHHQTTICLRSRPSSTYLSSAQPFSRPPTQPPLFHPFITYPSFICLPLTNH